MPGPEAPASDHGQSIDRHRIQKKTCMYSYEPWIVAYQPTCAIDLHTIHRSFATPCCICGRTISLSDKCFREMSPRAAASYTSDRMAAINRPNRTHMSTRETHPRKRNLASVYTYVLRSTNCSLPEQQCVLALC